MLADNTLTYCYPGLSDYTRALELDPGHFKAVYNRAFSYDKVCILALSALDPLPCCAPSLLRGPQMGRLEQAVTDYTRAIELEPRNANAYHNRGSTSDKVGPLFDYSSIFAYPPVSSQLGRIDDAIADFTRAIELDPSNASSYNSRGLARDRAGVRDEALEDFTKAVELEADNPVFRHNRGFCFRRVEMRAAEGALTSCLTMSPWLQEHGPV